jgi:hypothetical protein
MDMGFTPIGMAPAHFRKPCELERLFDGQMNQPSLFSGHHPDEQCEQ